MKKLKSKSRVKLYNMLSGLQEATGPAGRLAEGSIQFANQPIAGETVTIGGYVFQFQAGATEAPGTSAGTAADPHLVQTITDLATAGAELASAILAETATTGKWGYLYPDDSVGCVFSTDTLTLKFWPGSWGNAVTLAGNAGDETIVQPVTASLGRNPYVYDFSKKAMVIDTTGSTQDKEYYVINDGEYVGQEATILVKTLAASDTPSVVGHFYSSSGVEATFDTVNMWVKWVWNGASWEEVAVTAISSGMVYTAAA